MTPSPSTTMALTMWRTIVRSKKTNAYFTDPATLDFSAARSSRTSCPSYRTSGLLKILATKAGASMTTGNSITRSVRRMHLMRPSARQNWAARNRRAGPNSLLDSVFLAVRKTESRREFGPARRFLAAQFCLALGLIRCIRRTDLVILFPVVMLAPALVARIFRRPLVLYEGQDVLDERAAEKSSVAGSVKYAFVFLLRTIVLHMVNAIVVEGEGVIRQNHLDGLRSKTYRWHQYVDTQTYQVKRPIAARGELVGFLGTLDRRKGVLEFARAVRLVNARKKSVRFVIGGEGPLRGAVEAILADFVVDGTVRIVGLVQESAL